MGLFDAEAPPLVFRVEGDSMAPGLEDGQRVLRIPPAFHRNRLRRGDVVVLRRLEPPWSWIIKRVVGMPDEEIVLEGGRVYADDVLIMPLPAQAGPDAKRQEWWNGPEEYFVLGDNPAGSRDSRAFGPVPADRIIGRVWLRCWPPRAWGLVR